MDFETSIKALQERFAFQIREIYIKRYLKAKGINPERAPEFIFKSNMPSVERERMRNIQTLARRGIILRDPKVAMRLMEEMNLPVDYVKREIELWERDTTKTPEAKKEKWTDIGEKGETINPEDVEDMIEDLRDESWVP